jgi:hypothetical protein
MATLAGSVYAPVCEDYTIPTCRRFSAPVGHDWFYVYPQNYACICCLGEESAQTTTFG